MGGEDPEYTPGSYGLPSCSARGNGEERALGKRKEGGRYMFPKKGCGKRTKGWIFVVCNLCGEPGH